MTEAGGWHRLLERQLRRAGIDTAAAAGHPPLASLLDLVSATYDDTDQYRYLNDRAFELSSRELLELNEQLRQVGESKLAREHARLEAVYDSVAIGIIVVDEHGRIADLNGTARDQFPETESAIGLALTDVVHPATSGVESDRTFASLLRAISRGVTWRGDDVHIRIGASGDFPASVTFSPLREDDVPAGGVLAITDVTERHSAAEELAYRATHDPLTGLLNRTALLDYMTVALRALSKPSPNDDVALTAQRGIGVLFLDLDRFKLVNDTLGHAAGDDLLRIVVDRIRKVMRDGDTLARLGGDEFVILCEEADATVAMRVAERVVAAVSHPVALGKESAFVSASIGVTVSSPDCDAASLLRDADVAVYRAKATGRGRAVLFSDTMRSEVEERFRMERGLREALDTDGLHVVFQPLFRLSDRSLAGFETLVRWDRDGALVPPDQFVPLAEETGLIGALGSFVLREAASFLADVHTVGSRDATVAVNVSPIQLGEPELLAQLRSVVDGLPSPANRLVMEITETALLGDPDKARADLSALRALGVRIVLDDFGTGYSSLSTLRGFPLDGVKIDRSFIREVRTNTRDQSIVSAMTALGHALDMYIVAEGAETEEDVLAVADLGCDALQGFALSRPLTREAALDLARADVIRSDQVAGSSSGPVFASGK